MKRVVALLEGHMAGGVQNRRADGQAAGVDLPLLTAVAAMPVVLVLGYLPSHLHLPAIAALATGIAAAAAALGWAMRSDRRSATVTVWDFAGACLLIGIAAGAFSDPQHVAQFFGVAIAAP